MDWQPLEETHPRFYCGCTRAKSRRALRALTVEDLEHTLAENEPVQISCDFCGRNYTFEMVDISKVLEDKRREQAA